MHRNKASKFFMPQETLSENLLGGGGCNLKDTSLVVTTRSGERWNVCGNFPRVFAVGVCNPCCVETPGKPVGVWTVPIVPKILHFDDEEEEAVNTL